ncbi:MAG: pyridoxine 5'-phosphate synthase [Thermodesulfobacteriota bacterium]
MAGLAVNVDHIATLRQARGVSYPDPAAAAVLVELAGADGVVAHLRGDRRHINDDDVRKIKKIVLTRFILEMAPTDEMVDTALEVTPDLVTLVPERREEITTEGGLDLSSSLDNTARIVERLQRAGIRVSIFIDPDTEQIRRVRDTGAAVIEIHTGAFCEAAGVQEKAARFAKIREAARVAHDLGLGINAGHGLCYHTIKWFAGLKEIDEFSIGHSIVSRAALVGMDRAVRDMVGLIRGL